MARKDDHGLPSKDNIQNFWKGNREKRVELYNKESPDGDQLVVQKLIIYCIALKEKLLNEKGQAWHFCKVGRTKGTFEKRRGVLEYQIPEDIGTSFQIIKGPGNINKLKDNEVESIVRNSLGWRLTTQFAKDKSFPCPSEWIIVPAKFLFRVKRNSNSLTASYFRERNRFHEFLNEELNLLSNQEFKEYPVKFVGEIENIRIRFPVPKAVYLQNNGKIREASKKTNPLKGKCAAKKRVSTNSANEKRTQRGPSPGVQGIPSKKFISNTTTNGKSVSEKAPFIPLQRPISHLKIPKKSHTLRTPERNHTHIPKSHHDSKELSRKEHGKRNVPNRKKQLEPPGWIQSIDKSMPREHARPVQTPSINKEFTVEKQRTEPTTVQQQQQQQQQLQYHQNPTLQDTIPYQAPSYGNNYNQRNEPATETAYEINNGNRQLGSDQNNRYREPFGQFQRPTTTMVLKQEVNIQCQESIMTQIHSYNHTPFPPRHTSPEWAASSNMIYSQMNHQSLMSDYTTDEYLDDSSPEDARRVQISSSWKDTTPEAMRHGESFDRNPTLSNHVHPLYGTPSSSILKSSQRTISMNTTVSTDTEPGLPASVKTRFKDRLGNRPTGEQDFVSAPQLNTPLSSIQRRQGSFVSRQLFHEQFPSRQDDDDKILYPKEDAHKHSRDLRNRLKVEDQ